MEIAGTIIIEPNQFNKMAKKEPAERAKKESPIEKKGRTIMIRKYRKTRRLGRSINNRSPGLFVSILKNKILLHGGEWYEIDPFIVKASQYCHDTGQCHKIPLSQRRKMISGSMVLRDLYSAFIITQQSFPQSIFPFSIPNPFIKNLQKPVLLHIHVKCIHSQILLSASCSGQYAPLFRIFLCCLLKFFPDISHKTCR